MKPQKTGKYCPLCGKETIISEVGLGTWREYCPRCDAMEDALEFGRKILKKVKKG